MSLHLHYLKDLIWFVIKSRPQEQQNTKLYKICLDIMRQKLVFEIFVVLLYKQDSV